MKSIKQTFLLLVCIALSGVAQAQVIKESGTSKTVTLGADGKLVYAQDAKGNRLPDFSYVGYHSGEMAIPIVSVKKTLTPHPGDNTDAINNAIEELGKRAPDMNGHRGALLLKRGVYRVDGTLRISHSGIVLRGEGDGPDGTIIVAAGYGDKKHKRTLITVGGSERIAIDKASKQEIFDEYVPVGTHSFTVKSSKGFNVGDRIALHRPATAEWISSIGCDKLKSRWATIDGKKVDQTKQWTPDGYGLYFERRITAVKGDTITIDAPNVHMLDAKFGGGAIYNYETKGRITEVGIENLRLVSEFAKPVPGNAYGDPKESTRSENHGWHAIKLSRNTENTWVRNVTGNYFGWSVVSASGKRATVQDCVSLGHASQISGGRRYPFMIDGQMNLVQRCLTFEGRHEFVNQARTLGPNVFVDCVGFKSKSSAGPHHRYAVGNLYDNIKSENMMESRFRGNSGTGHGWAGTQTCFYNCVARGFSVGAPPGGISWVIGSGKSDAKGVRVSPASLYYQQVEERLGKTAVDRLATPEQRENVGKYLWVASRLAKEGKKAE